MNHTLDPRWLNFVLLVTVQWGIGVALAGAMRARVKQIVAACAIGLLLGIPFGLGFDLLIGRNAGIFGYYLPPRAGFIFLNGLLSYGAAVATAAFFPRLILPDAASEVEHRKLVLLFWLLILGAALVSFIYAAGPLGSMFRAGAIILALGEVVAALCGRRTALAALVHGMPGPLLKFWAAAAGIGALYEIVNLCFPVWHWVPIDSAVSWPVEFVVVAFGYVVLFHPLRLIWQLIFPGFARREPRGPL